MIGFHFLQLSLLVRRQDLVHLVVDARLLHGEFSFDLGLLRGQGSNLGFVEGAFDVLAQLLVDLAGLAGTAASSPVCSFSRMAFIWAFWSSVRLRCLAKKPIMCPSMPNRGHAWVAAEARRQSADLASCSQQNGQGGDQQTKRIDFMVDS